jgi:hypothetical protein
MAVDAGPWTSSLAKRMRHARVSRTGNNTAAALTMRCDGAARGRQRHVAPTRANRFGLAGAYGRQLARPAGLPRRVLDKARQGWRDAASAGPPGGQEKV